MNLSDQKKKHNIDITTSIQDKSAINNGTFRYIKPKRFEGSVI